MSVTIQSATAPASGSGGGTVIANNVSVGSGSSFTISGLTLTGYKRLELIVKQASVAAGAAVALSINSNTFGNLTTTTRSPVVTIDLTSGVMYGPNTAVGNNDSGLSTASTSITATLASSTFNAGTYYLIGYP